LLNVLSETIIQEGVKLNGSFEFEFTSPQGYFELFVFIARFRDFLAEKSERLVVDVHHEQQFPISHSLSRRSFEDRYRRAEMTMARLLSQWIWIKPRASIHDLIFWHCFAYFQEDFDGILRISNCSEVLDPPSPAIASTSTVGTNSSIR
jgi:hypothetical protein